jgi:hypothetical protein
MWEFHLPLFRKRNKCSHEPMVIACPLKRLMTGRKVLESRKKDLLEKS